MLYALHLLPFYIMSWDCRSASTVATLNSLRQIVKIIIRFTYNIKRRDYISSHVQSFLSYSFRYHVSSFVTGLHFTMCWEVGFSLCHAINFDFCTVFEILKFTLQDSKGQVLRDRWWWQWLAAGTVCPMNSVFLHTLIVFFVLNLWNFFSSHARLLFGYTRTGWDWSQYCKRFSIYFLTCMCLLHYWLGSCFRWCC